MAAEWDYSNLFAAAIPATVAVVAFWQLIRDTIRERRAKRTPSTPNATDPERPKPNAIADEAGHSSGGSSGDAGASGR